jgi:four helix bundle suffix protein
VNNPEPLIPKHGGYRNLVSFKVAQLVYDVTVRFCNRYVDKRSRTHDQMVQAARSGVQNIAEGSQASGTSKKFELKLTSVARASLEELLLDYEDFLRQRDLALWGDQDARRWDLVHRRCASAEEVAVWAQEVRAAGASNYPEIAANGALALIGVACSLLERQMATQSSDFAEAGGFTERMYRVRQARRREGGGGEVR